MSKVISKYEKFERGRPDDWRLGYIIITNPTNGKKVGFFRLDWGANYKMLKENDFLEYIKKLESTC